MTTNFTNKMSVMKSYIKKKKKKITLFVSRYRLSFIKMIYIYVDLRNNQIDYLRKINYN